MVRNKALELRAHTKQLHRTVLRCKSIAFRAAQPSVRSHRTSFRQMLEMEGLLLTPLSAVGSVRSDFGFPFQPGARCPARGIGA